MQMKKGIIKYDPGGRLTLK